MTPLANEERIRAVVGQDFSGLTEEQVLALLSLLNESPELFCECQLDLATKLFLSRYRTTSSCPAPTAEAIRSAIDHLYRASKASIS